MARNEKSRNRNNSYRPNVWGMLRDVLVASMNKGQLLLMGIVLVLLVIVFRYPQDEIPNLVDKLFNLSKFLRIFGWVTAAFAVAGGFIVTRWLRKLHTKEIRRISQEKKRLQEQLKGKKLPSSNKNK